MNILFHACSAAIKSKSRSLVGYHSTCRISINSALESLLVRSYSSAMTKRDGSKEKKKNASKGEKKNGSKGGKKNGSQGKKPDHAHAPKKKDEKNAFFVVRKGGLVGIYKSLNDCQFQSGSSNCDPPVSVYKGYSMTKKTKKYLNSRGIKDALYSLSAKDFTENLFGTLLPCTLKKVSHEAVRSKNGVIPFSWLHLFLPWGTFCSRTCSPPVCLNVMVLPKQMDKQGQVLCYVQIMEV
ncbi:unnamed protein product [Cuscuta europaea]|uniref:Uncharacterized protein n=1 Tax=Cuscuta europaea TaxID=41803 RepID=A0A9P1E9Z0_CUSEU|nr:unnamed protein product [Cuscuta europaea]